MARGPAGRGINNAAFPRARIPAVLCQGWGRPLRTILACTLPRPLGHPETSSRGVCNVSSRSRKKPSEQKPLILAPPKPQPPLHDLPNSHMPSVPGSQSDPLK